MFKRLFMFFACQIVLVAYLYSNTANDMLNRKIEIPKKAKKAFSPSPPITAMLYSIAPETMIGANYSFYEIEKEFMLEDVKSLPVLGGFFGSNRQVNLEKLLSLSPDIVFMWSRLRKNEKFFEKNLEKFGIPVVYIHQDTILEMLDTIKTMGIFLKKEQRAKKLIAYAKKNLSKISKSVKNLDSKKIAKKRVYIALGGNGLTSECTQNIHSQIISLARGLNVSECEGMKKDSSQKVKITLEKLYKYNPDVIFVRRKAFFDSIKNLKTWKKLKAYKQKQIYFIPTSPFNWIGRPPSLMRFLGIMWMHKKLYPKYFNVDINKEVRDFYELFLHKKLTNKDINKLIRGE